MIVGIALLAALTLAVECVYHLVAHFLGWLDDWFGMRAYRKLDRKRN